jgi:hypothetical protein
MMLEFLCFYRRITSGRRTQKAKVGSCEGNIGDNMVYASKK